MKRDAALDSAVILAHAATRHALALMPLGDRPDPRRAQIITALDEALTALDVAAAYARVDQPSEAGP